MVKVTQKKNFVISRLLSAEALVSFTQKVSNMLPSWSGWSGDGRSDQTGPKKKNRNDRMHGQNF